MGIPQRGIMTEEYKRLLVEAHELCDFFTGTYAEEVIGNAINTHDPELLRIVLKEYQSQRQLIEEQAQEA